MDSYRIQTWLQSRQDRRVSSHTAVRQYFKDSSDRSICIVFIKCKRQRRLRAHSFRQYHHFYLCVAAQTEFNASSVESKGAYISDLRNNKVDYPEGLKICPSNYMHAWDSLVQLGLWTRQMSQGGFMRSVASLATKRADGGSAPFPRQTHLVTRSR
jgi:hypothetical protein